MSDASIWNNFFSKKDDKCLRKKQIKLTINNEFFLYFIPNDN